MQLYEKTASPPHQQMAGLVEDPAGHKTSRNSPVLPQIMVLQYPVFQPPVAVPQVLFEGIFLQSRVLLLPKTLLLLLRPSPSPGTNLFSHFS